MKFDWRNYERQIHHTLFFEYPGAEVIDNLKIVGESSKSERQIDIGIRIKKGKKHILGIAECKLLKRKISIPAIDELVGKMIDVKASFGIIITTIGCTDSTIEYAAKKNIEIKIIPFEFLKDYGFILSNFLGDITELFQQEVNYPMDYCKKCNKTNLYEIKIVRGFAEYGEVECPECETELFTTRLDGDYRVIKRFSGSSISEGEINRVIVDHLVWTRDSWDRRYSLLNLIKPITQRSNKNNCYLCYKQFDELIPDAWLNEYKNKLICTECMMSHRTLLLDFIDR